MAEANPSMLLSGVYQIRNIINGKVYIGSAANVTDRWLKHRRLLVAGRHHSIALQRAWLKYGSNSFAFEVLATVPESDLLRAEQQHLDAIQPFRNKGYNISLAAGSPMKGRKHTAETLAKMSASLVNPSQETRAKLSAAGMGRKMSPEAIAKSCAARANPSPETREKMAAWQRGRKMSAESIAKSRAANLNPSPERRARLSEAARNRSPESRAKLSASLTGLKKTPEAKAAHAAAMRRPDVMAKIIGANKGRKASAETRAKMSAAHKGRKRSDEATAKIAAAHRGMKRSPETCARIAAAVRESMRRRSLPKNQATFSFVDDE